MSVKASNDNLELVLDDIAEQAKEIRDEAVVHDGEPSPCELGVVREYWSGEAV